MAAIDFGTGANTATGDTVAQALAKLQARLDALPTATPTPSPTPTPTPTPAPSFTTQPSVSPSSGTAGSTTFTATAGTVSNGTVTSRAWLLNGTSISTGLTALPTAAGTLTYQETATGSGGTKTSTVQQVTVAAAASNSTGTVPDGTQAKITGIGDSIMRGLSADYPALSKLGYPTTVTIDNRGQDNRTIWEAAYDAQAGSGWGSAAGSWDSSKTNVLILQRATNDLGKNSGLKGDDVYADMAGLVRLYKNQGFYVAVETCLPRYSEWDSTKETQRLRYNTLVRQNAMGADLIIDSASDSVIGDSGDLASKTFQTSYPGAATTYYADGVHLTTAGQDRKAVIYKNALPALLTLSPRAKGLFPATVAAAAYTTQPSITPTSGGSGTTFTAVAGSITNGRVYSRTWLLNGTAISTGGPATPGSGLTATPSSTGTLVYREVAYGLGGGNGQSNDITVTVGSSTPAAAFTAQPTVSPTSGAPGATFTATPGTVSNGTVTSRSWKLGGTEISTGLTATPTAAGTLTYQEFATGSGGNASSSITSITVAAASGGTTTGDPATSRTTAMAYGAGKFGTARTAGTVLIPTTAVPATPTQPITFEIWAMLPTSADKEAWLMCTDRAAGDNNTWGLLCQSDGKMRLTYSNKFNQGGQVSTTFTMRDGAWHHYRVRLLGTSIEVDVDGTLVAQLTGAPITGAAMVLGEIYQNAYGLGWVGSFDEFAAFSGARTGAAPTAAYTGSEANLMALYHFDGNLASGK